MTTTTNGVSVDAILAQTKLDPARNATSADVANLVRAYKALSQASKDKRTADSNLAKGMAVWSADADYTTLQDAADEAHRVWVETLRTQREVIDALPTGVTGPGGKATRQTLVLEFYGPVNRNLQSRLTSGDAKKINKASFGG